MGWAQNEARPTGTNRENSIRVTNLNTKGPGSFRDALQASGPRIVVFEVGGAIDLNMRSISISNPFLTVAGQTAPSPGITLIRGGLSISTHQGEVGGYPNPPASRRKLDVPEENVDRWLDGFSIRPRRSGVDRATRLK